MRTPPSKTLDSIAKSLLEHCLWYYVREGGAPKIIVIDGFESKDLDNLYEEHMHSSSSSETLDIKEHNFEITHIKFRASSSNHHSVSYCAAKRLVKEDKLAGKIPGLIGKINDDNGDFIYSCFISSPYLDEKVRSERTSFDLEENIDGLFSESEISWKDIRDAIIPKIRKHLDGYLTANIEAGKKGWKILWLKKLPATDQYYPVSPRMN